MNFYRASNFNPCIIAETACGHDGSLKKLKRLIEIAKQSGSNTIKFQIYKLDERSNKNTKEERIFKKLLLTNSEWKDAVNFAHKKKLFVFADVFGFESLNIAQKIGVDGFKIHSEDSLNFKFIEKVLDLKKITIIGVGGSHRIEVKSLLDYLKKKKLLKKIILMTGVQTFPTPLEAHSIPEVSDLLKKYSQSDIKVGFSDHVSGGTEESFFLPIMALSAGASFIEKHFTTDRKLKQTDFQSSLNQREFKTFITFIKKYQKVLKPIKELNKWEKSYRAMFKKSPVLKKNKIKGEIVYPNDIIFKKNITKTQSLNIKQICNKKILNNITAGENLTLNKIYQKVGIIIVVRNSSSRLPKKALGKICGRESIACLIDRMKKVKNAAEIILATSKSNSDNILEKIAKRENIKCFRGSLENVASRYYNAAKKFNLDHVVRITGDAILADVKMIDEAIMKQLKKGSDVVFIKNMPYGTAKEVFSLRAIEAIANYSIEPEKTEYLEWFLENNRNFKVEYIKSKYKFDKSIRLTLDYKEDLLQLNKIFKGLKSKKNFNLLDVLNFLKKNKKIVKINSHLRPKFDRSEINTNLSI
jgi:spore coat polysaccharide biosynthesis protein SpsF (cytidylyltransferase family)/sialic acid synthase SpsE